MCCISQNNWHPLVAETEDHIKTLIVVRIWMRVWGHVFKREPGFDQKYYGTQQNSQIYQSSQEPLFIMYQYVSGAFSFIVFKGILTA